MKALMRWLSRDSDPATDLFWLVLFLLLWLVALPVVVHLRG